MDLSTLNPWAILVATIAGFVLGGIWYSPLLFARRWMAAAGLDEATLQNANMGKIFGGAFALTLLAAANLAAFLGPERNPGWGVAAGLLAAVWVCAALGVLYLFERRPLALFVINGGYWLVTFATMGAILGTWK